MSTQTRPYIAVSRQPETGFLANPKTRRALFVKLPVFLALSFIAFTTLYPLGYMVMTALKERTEYFTNPYGFPQAVYFDNIRIIIENYGLLTSFGNSILIVGCSVTLCVLLSSLTAFAIAKLRFRGKRVFFYILISLQLIPGQVMLIPIYLLFSRLGMINNYLSVILMYTVGSLPFGTFLLSASFRGIPDELIEAAKIDGASLRQVFQHIVLPVGRPSILTLAILNFLSMWNELILALLLLPDENKRTVTASVSMVIGRFVTNQPLLMTGLLLSSLPTIVVLAMFSKYLVRGIAAGIGK